MILKGSVPIKACGTHAPGVWKREDWDVNSQQLLADGNLIEQIGVQNQWNVRILWAGHVALPPVGKGLADLLARVLLLRLRRADPLLHAER